MECDKCGSLISTMHNFCPTCGYKVSGETKKKKKKKEVKKRTSRCSKQKKRYSTTHAHDTHTVTNEEILAHREKIIENTIEKVKSANIYDVSIVFFKLILATIWLRVVIGSFLLFVEHGFSPRCGWEGNQKKCYMVIWEKISRTYVPYIAFIQGSTSLDCFVRWVRGDTSDFHKRAFRRCIGRPAILLGVIGFDGMHHINYVYRGIFPALFVFLWSFSEGLQYASEASKLCDVAVFFQWLNRNTKGFLSHAILFVELALIFVATFYTRRVFSYPLVRAGETKTWKELEGMGFMPLEVTWVVRVLASVYGLTVFRECGSFIKRLIFSKRGVRTRSDRKVKTK